MKDFLEKLLACIDSYTNFDIKQIKQNEQLLYEYFCGLEEHTQRQCINTLKISEQDNVWLFSYLLQVLKTEKIQSVIEDIMWESKISVLEILNIIYQVDVFLFFTPLKSDEKFHYKYQVMIYRKQAERIWAMLDKEFSYIPYSKRNKKRVLLMCRTFLSEGHAPTAKIVNIYRYLELLGYEPYVLCTYMGKVEKGYREQWYNSYAESSIFRNTGTFSVEYFGVHVDGGICYYSSQNFYEEITEVLMFINEYNPAFILDIGGDNIAACLSEKFTTVCSMACVKKPPLTTVSVIARYFQYSEGENRKYMECLDENQTVIDMVHVDELSASVNQVHKKSDYGIDENTFVILIAGNRLDREVSDEFLQVLNQVLERQDNAAIVFVGDCVELKKVLMQDRFADKYTFVGKVKDFKGIMSIGDLFLNPPRQGGGTGAYYAIAKGVPVLTLPNCDVAQTGEQFTCEKLEDMAGIIDRYIHDENFMENQKKYCMERTNILYGVDNLGNIKKFIDTLETYILAKEKMK